MSDRILITGLRVFGKHGVEPPEREYGQDFLIDLDCRLDLTEAARTDLLENTLDYAALTAQVKGVVENETYFLIEALAQRLADAVLENRRVKSVTVAIAKPDVAAQLGMERVEVRMTRKRK